MTDKIPFAVDKSEFLDGTWVSSTWLEPILHLNEICFSNLILIIISLDILKICLFLKRLISDENC